MNTLYVRTKTQKAIFENELQGQLSDGRWENEDTDRRLWNCAVVVTKRGQKLGCTFRTMFPVNFCDDDLVEWLSDRMIGYALKVRKSYTRGNLIKDLKELTVLVYGK
jgi:hypothetical protein